MNSHDLAKELLKIKSVPLTVSVDVSTCDMDSGNRAFGDEYCGLQFENDGTITLLFAGGTLNYD